MFEAGGIGGGLKLDLSDFTSGILEAQGLSAAFPSVVTSFLVDPLLGVVQVAQQASSALISAFAEVGNRSADLSLAAEKAGVTVEYFSTLAAVGASVGVSMESLGAGFRFLDRNAADAVDGTMPKAAAAFERLGLSTEFLKQNLGNPAAIFDAVREKLSELPDEAQRSAAAMQLLGRGGESLIPLLNLQASQFDSLAQTMKGLGAVEDEESARSGRAFKTLESIASGAWEGLKRAFAEPLLGQLGGDVDQIVPTITALSTSLRAGIGEGLQIIWPVAQGVYEVFKGIGEVAASVWVPTFTALKPILTDLSTILGGALQVIGVVLQNIAAAIQGINELLGLTNQVPSPSVAGGQAGGIAIGSVNVEGVDTEAAASQIAAQLAPQIRAGLRHQHQQLAAVAHSSKVARATGGRRH